MIKKNTVLILGAGASMPYGFPVGSQLVQRIFLTNRDDIVGAWRPYIPKDTYRAHRKDIHSATLDQAREHIKAFQNKLRQADPPSIDAFLGHWPQFGEIGKVAIGLALRDTERSSVGLMNRSTKGGWYHILLDEMLRGATPVNFGDNKLRVITYNYDRSLEYYIYSRLLGMFDIDEAKAIELLKQIPIVHIHGCLGPIDFDNEGSKNPYHSLRPETHIEAANNIILISEGEVNPTYETAHSWIAWAEQVAFLGFGYHEDNLDRLRLFDYAQFLRSNAPDEKTTYTGGIQKAQNPNFTGLIGTSYGIRTVRQGQIWRYFRQLIRLEPLPIDEYLAKVPLLDT